MYTKCLFRIGVNGWHLAEEQKKDTKQKKSCYRNIESTHYIPAISLLPVRARLQGNFMSSESFYVC